MAQNKIYMASRIALLLGCVCFTPMAFAGASAQMLANNCVACHGPDGNSAGPAIPSIAGIDKGNFFDMMDSYKSENGRYSTIMGRIAKGFNDQEIELLAGYFASKKRATPTQQLDPQLVAKGAKIHDKSCEKCHADLNGGDIILNGQWKPYLLNAMHDFSALDPRSIRMKDLKKMVKKLKKLSADERQAVASFYASRKYEEAKND